MVDIKHTQSVHFAINDEISALVNSKSNSKSRKRAIKRAFRISYIECLRKITNQITTMFLSLEEINKTDDERTGTELASGGKQNLIVERMNDASRLTVRKSFQQAASFIDYVVPQNCLSKLDGFRIMSFGGTTEAHIRIYLNLCVLPSKQYS
uniref:Uncharacterized protein n=1 Tax=Onchocerca volvulus TaxID=6282 RepID=A0A8R1XY98_ONCVO